jgi:transposase
MAKYKSVKEALYNFMKENPELETSSIAECFIGPLAPERSVYRWIKQVKDKGTLERKISSGRPVKIATTVNIRKLKKMFNHRSGRSQRAAARKFGCTQPYISKLLKQRTNIRHRKKMKRPLLSEQQRKLARPKCRKILQHYGDCHFLIDDESYFTLSHTDQPGNECFYTDNLNKTPDNVKYNYKEKYPDKLLVWLAISPKGMTKPIFRKSGNAINQDVYLQMLQKELVPFIKKNYSTGGYVFWPDLASAHYAGIVTKYLKDQNIPYVPKFMNPANLPKARPIEDFWANLKAEVYKNNWTAKNLEQLENRIRLCLGKMDTNLVQRHALAVRKRLDHIRRYGP